MCGKTPSIRQEVREGETAFVKCLDESEVRKRTFA